MKALLQRVSTASVTIKGKTIASINSGLLILVGIGQNDDKGTGKAMAEKIASLRIFEDDKSKMNLSILDTHGSALVVSQFTLYANTSRGRRPAFVEAASPDKARILIDEFAQALRDCGIPTHTGEFGATMQVTLTNDGPVTIALEI